MTRARFLVGAIAASLAMSVAPAFAQRSASSGEATGGSAVSRGGGGDSGGGAVSGGDSGGSTGSSGSSSTPSAGSPSQPAREYVTAPTRPSERAQGRTRGGGSSSSGSSDSGGRAVPRDSGGGAPAGGATTRSAGGPSTAPSDRAVPAYSRPRDGRPARGTAVERTFPPVDGGGGRIIYYPRFYGRSYYLPAYGLGLGFYDPFWYDPYYYGGYGTYGYPYGGYGYGSGAAYGSGSYDRVGTGSLRLKIKPRDAEVYVDGYFVGTVDEFDGLFQKLRIDAGGHRIEIRAEGYEVTAFDVLITPGETVTYQGELKPGP